MLVIAAVLLLVVLNQIRVIRRSGVLLKYLAWFVSSSFVVVRSGVGVRTNTV